MLSYHSKKPETPWPNTQAAKRFVPSPTIGIIFSFAISGGMWERTQKTCRVATAFVQGLAENLAKYFAESGIQDGRFLSLSIFVARVRICWLIDGINQLIHSSSLLISLLLIVCCYY